MQRNKKKKNTKKKILEIWFYDIRSLREVQIGIGLFAHYYSRGLMVTHIHTSIRCINLVDKKVIIFFLVLMILKEEKQKYIQIGDFRFSLGSSESVPCCCVFQYGNRPIFPSREGNLQYLTVIIFWENWEKKLTLRSTQFKKLNKIAKMMLFLHPFVELVQLFQFLLLSIIKHKNFNELIKK